MFGTETHFPHQIAHSTRFCPSSGLRELAFHLPPSQLAPRSKSILPCWIFLLPIIPLWAWSGVHQLVLDCEHGSLQTAFCFQFPTAHPLQVYQSEYLKRKPALSSQVQIFNDHLPLRLYSSVPTPLPSPGASLFAHSKPNGQMVSADGLHSAGSPCSDCATFSLRHHFCSLQIQTVILLSGSSVLCDHAMWALAAYDRNVSSWGRKHSRLNITGAKPFAWHRTNGYELFAAIALLFYCLPLPFFNELQIFRQSFLLVSIVVPNTRLNLINPTCVSP